MRPQGKNDEVRVVRLHKRPMTVISECVVESEPECALQRGENTEAASGERSEVSTTVCSSTPLERLEEDYIRCMRVSVEEHEQESAVYIHEGSDMMSQLKDQLAMLPELQDLSPRCDILKADVGEPGVTTEVQERQLKEILKRHCSILLGDGNAAPAPARGVVCDLDVGDAKPAVQRPRPVAPQAAIKVYELLKKLLETKLIEHSESPWASPIVIVQKKNGVDIRMCIDYRVVNGFIQLSNYPLPLIDDLLTGFEGATWFMSLDMASGFWAVRMTERAKLISAFVCPFGHFKWVRMPSGLKNAPLIYQHMINNCLWGFVRLPPEEEVLVDQDVLDYLELGPQRPEKSEVDHHLTALTEPMTVFRRNIPAPSQMGPVLGRRSYIDDIAHGARTWDELCEDLDALLYRLRYSNISVSLPKSEFGKRTIPYLSHEIGAEGIRAIPKIVKGIQDLPFPSTLKGVQSFLGSLNYDHKFIEDFPVVAAVFYELSDEQVRAGRDLSRSKEAFDILKQKIVATPLLRHSDRTKPFVVIPHANQWAACAVHGQEHDGVIQPDRFTGGVLNDAELRYHIAEKEVLAVIQVLHVFKTLIEGCPLVVYTRHSVLKWVIKTKAADENLVSWGVALSQYDLEIQKVQRDEDGLAAILGADKIAESLIPAKGCVKAPPPPPVISIEMLEADYTGVVLSFDGAAKTSTRIGSCGCVLDARGYILDGVTVNDAEYFGLLRGLAMARDRGIQDLVVVVDSRIVIQQVQGLINCNQPNLQRRLAECEVLKKRFNSVRLVHVKREFNQAADYLTSKTLALGKSWGVEEDAERKHLEVVSRIREQLVKTSDEETKLNSEMPKNSPNVVTMGVSEDVTLCGPECEPLPSLREDMLHYAHEDFQGGHEGMYADVERFVKECVDCASGKGSPPNAGPSPGNIEPARPFEAVSMDFVTHLPESVRGNTFLLLFQDMFSGYMMCKPMASKTAQNVAEAYEESVFRRFGASSVIRHDQDPRFMSEVFARFRDLIGNMQRATLAYRPQANGQQERSVQTVIRSVKAYVAEADQSDWDEHAERLMFALNTSFDATRLNTPFYLVHGWDTQGTVSAMLGPKPSTLPERTAYEWRRKFQRDYSYALACAEELQRKAKRARSEEQTRKWRELSDRLKAGFEKGDAVWLYIPKVQPGLSRKLARLWHGPFRIEDVRDDFRVKLKVEDLEYRVNPWVHISRLKPRAIFSRRPKVEVEVEDDDDFDAALLPEDSWEPDNANDVTMEGIQDVRWVKRTRTSKPSREYLVKWKGYADPEWIPVSQLSCGVLLYEFNKGARAKARFQAMQAGDDHPRA
ncbi:LOW QUALITY PROTEIN: Reverse transcriptase [Phytophthora palmivora]|uniref:Reverse transcriptase n=1 Tax=Phytophthora palmivora TaxID=4796 RepID=A0A2P4YMM3_9STRA|nr:LOW QUALITY PROTEIN: Reverse transcriptase [Phytophthora palmivora]